MDPQQVINGLLSVLLLVSGALIKVLWDAVKDLRDDMRALGKSITDVEVAMPTNYVAKKEHSDAMIRIETLLARIDSKLDNKADKDQ